MNLRQRVKRLEAPREEANDYLIRDFDAVCAGRAMRALTCADPKMLAERVLYGLEAEICLSRTSGF